MIEQKEWVFYKDIEWTSPTVNTFNVDTRDFHVGYGYKEGKHKDWNTISKYTHFFFSEDELKVLLDRLYTESGGDGEWRMLDLESSDKRVTNWNLKYLRIQRTDNGFLVCNSNYNALPKMLLNLPINKEFLNHH